MHLSTGGIVGLSFVVVMLVVAFFAMLAKARRS
jgi:hypothetical protein